MKNYEFLFGTLMQGKEIEKSEYTINVLNKLIKLFKFFI
jgi:hypothetical protein